MSQDDPIARFVSEYERAGATEQFEVSRCALATADGEGRPAVRFVLLRGFDADGFVFFTNFESPKAKHLSVNPHAELAFLAIEFWENRDDRLHDRWLYKRDSDAWRVARLYP